MIRTLFCLAFAGCQCAPQTQITDLVVEATYPGASFAEVSDQVLLPLEVELSHIEGLTHMVSIADSEKGRLYLRFEGVGDGLSVLQGSRERLATVHESLPAQIDGLQVWEHRARQVWVRAGEPAVGARTVGELAQTGVRAELITSTTNRRVWTVDPEALRRELVDGAAVVAAVDLALNNGLPVDADLPVPTLKGADQATTLGAVAQERVEPGAVEAYLNNGPAAIIAVEGTTAPAGWMRPTEAAPGRICSVFRGMGEQVPEVHGLWVLRGQIWTVRGRPGRTGLDAGLGSRSWDCTDDPPRRVALVARDLDADLDVALASLRQFPGVLEAIPASTGQSRAEIGVDIARGKVAALGLTVGDVTGAVAWSGRPRPGDAHVVLRLPDRDPDRLAALPIVSSTTGQMVPLSAVADLSVVAADDPLVRVNGRDALLLDTMLADPTVLERWAAPSDVELLILDGMGPETVGL